MIFLIWKVAKVLENEQRDFWSLRIQSHFAWAKKQKIKKKKKKSTPCIIFPGFSSPSPQTS